MSCPLDCEYLREARRHEKPVSVDPEQIPNRDVPVSEEFLEEHGKLVTALAYAVAAARSAALWWRCMRPACSTGV